MKTCNLHCGSIQELMAYSAMPSLTISILTTMPFKFSYQTCLSKKFFFSFISLFTIARDYVKLTVHLSEKHLGQIQAQCKHSLQVQQQCILNLNNFNSPHSNPFNSLQLRLHLALSLTLHEQFQVSAFPEKGKVKLPLLINPEKRMGCG